MAGVRVGDITWDLRPWGPTADGGTVDAVEAVIIVAWLVAAALVGLVILVARNEDG